MSEFASCYFCGTALDAQIEPYPVVPEDPGTDDQPTVDLCPVCRRKLSKILDVALSAAEGAETTATPLTAGPDPSPLSADHEDPTADMDSEDETAEGPAYAVEPGGEATAVEDTAEADGDGSVDDERDVDDADGDDGEADTDSAEDEPEDDDEPDADEPEVDDEPEIPAAGEESTSAASVAEGDDAVANGETPGTTADDGDDRDASDADDPTETDTEGAAQSESNQPSVLSTPAAQKVIKLLQNREFPVEREEIEVVASNAYAIPDQDCADVIDALVSEGYVDEQQGQLVRPEE